MAAKNEERKEKKKPKDKPESGVMNDEGEAGIFEKILLGFLFIIIVGGISAFLFLNVFSVRQNFIIPQLRRVPIVRNFIPYLPGDYIEEQIEEDSPNRNLTRKELSDKVEALESQIERLMKDSDDKETLIASLNRRIADLSELETQRDLIRAEQTEFYEMIANDDQNAFARFYESVDPETAERIYAQTVNNNAITAEIRRYTQTFQEMKPDSAAAILEEMVRTDSDTVILILQNVDARQRALILSNMTPRNASALSRRIIGS
jgi:flagellar motility protein MotE (MotC chaperone)